MVVRVAGPGLLATLGWGQFLMLAALQVDIRRRRRRKRRRGGGEEEEKEGEK